MNRYDVIFLNMQQFLIRAKNEEVSEYLERVVLQEIRQTYGELFSDQETILAAALEQIYAKTGQEFISKFILYRTQSSLTSVSVKPVYSSSAF